MMKSIKSLIAFSLLGLSQQAMAITINFDYSLDTNNFFDTQAKKDVLEAAGSYFETAIQDTLDPINTSGGNVFNARFDHPGTGNLHTIDNYNVAQDTLVIFAGGRSLPGSTLGIGGPGGFTASGTSQSFFDGIRTRGEPGVDPNNGTNSTDFAPWGGGITFDTDASANWYFDPDVSTDADVVNNDFFSIALHELGHVFGYGTSDSWNNLVDGSNFTGAASTAVNSSAVPLHGDLSHWQNGVMSTVNGNSQEAAMDPSIQTGTRKVFTDLDVAGLRDIGWEVTVIPIPPAVWLFGSGLFGLISIARRRT